MKTDQYKAAILSREDIQVIKDSPHLYSLVFEFDEGRWVATSVILDENDNFHHHGLDRSARKAIEKMELECGRYYDKPKPRKDNVRKT